MPDISEVEEYLLGDQVYAAQRLCALVGHDYQTHRDTVGLKHGAEMKVCGRCGLIGYVVFP